MEVFIRRIVAVILLGASYIYVLSIIGLIVWVGVAFFILRPKYVLHVSIVDEVIPCVESYNKELIKEIRDSVINALSKRA